MAERPLSKVLPADLPVDWTNDQYISADGEEVGLTTQYGYNYLNAQINESQTGINTLNNAFEGLATINYVNGQLGAIDEIEDSVLQHANDSVVHTTSSEKAKWNTVGIISNLNTAVKTDLVSALNEVNDKTTGNVIVTSYGYQPSQAYSTTMTSPSVVSTTSSSVVAIPNSKISIENPWGNASRKIKISACIQTAAYNSSSFSYTSGAGIYLIPSLTWSSSSAVVKGGTSGGTSKYILGSVALTWEATSSATYPVSLWLGKLYDASSAVVLGWNMIVVQTKI